MATVCPVYCSLKRHVFRITNSHIDRLWGFVLTPSKCVGFFVCVETPFQTSISGAVIPHSDASAGPPGHMYRVSEMVMYVKVYDVSCEGPRCKFRDDRGAVG